MPWTSRWLAPVLVVLALLAGRPAAAGDKVVRFGRACDLSKVYTFAVAEIVQARQDYVELLDPQGGVDGHRLEFLVEGSGNEPQRALTPRVLEDTVVLDARGLRPPLAITPEDRGGGQLTRIGQWDGSRFVKVADWKAPFQDVVAEQVRKDAEEFRRTGR